MAAVATFVLKNLAALSWPGFSWQLPVTLVITVLTLLAITFRPKNISEATSAGIGALLFLALGLVKWPIAGQVILDSWDVLFFFLGMMTIAAVAESAGFFNWAAAQAARYAGGSSRRLFLNIFLLGALISTFLSNDATALILTPIVFTIVTRLKLNPLPYMFACTFIADTASFVLPVSNPINIIILHSFQLSLPTFLRYLLLPSLLAIGLNIALFFLIFRKSLGTSFKRDELGNPSASILDPAFFRFVWICLGLIALAYIGASLAGQPVSIVALAGGAVLTGGGFYFRRITPYKLAKEISWPIFLFIVGMTIVVRGIEQIGVTQALAGLLVDLGRGHTWASILSTTLLSALGANLINNVPMALVMTATLRSIAQSAAFGQLHTPLSSLVSATILGADLGPNITTVGSLATILWLLILRRKGLEVSSVDYFKIGIVVTPLILVCGALAIWLVG